MAVYADKKNGKPTGRWCVEVTLAGKRKRYRFDDYNEAKRVEALWKAGKDDAPSTTIELTLSELPRLCAKDLWPNSPERLADVERKVRLLVEWVGNPTLAEMDYQWMVKTAERLRDKGRSPATINRYWTSLSPMLKHAVKSGWLDKLPEFKWQHVDNGRIRWLTDAEEAALLTFLTANGFEHVRDFVVVALDTGCRRGELLAAQPGWVQQLDGKWWLHIPAPETKGKKDRSIPLTPRANTILRHALPWRLSFGNLRYAWDKAARHMGLENDPWFVLHACRHTCATRLVQKGVNLKVVKEWMGHSSILVTDRYAHNTPDMMLDAVARLGGN